MSTVKSSRIEQFFDSAGRKAQGLLPKLVRRLIIETVPLHKLSALRIPVEDDVGMRGFDGIVETTSPTGPFVPVGRSVWEISTGDPAGEFAENYKKRKGDADSGKTFVFVTPHKWAGKRLQTLLGKSRDDGLWQDVEVVDAVQLEQWLEMKPATSRWLIAQWGAQSSGYWEVSTYVAEEIHARYGVEVDPSLLVGGRDEECKELASWLESSESRHRVIGDTVEEAAAFIVGVVLGLGDSRSHFEGRILLVDDPDALQALVSAELPYIVVALNDDVRKRAEGLITKGVRILSPCQRDEPIQVADRGETVLHPLRRESVEESLQAMGLRREEASAVARESKGSLTAVLWQIQESTGNTLPWVSPEAAAVLLPALLLAEWEDGNQADWELIEELSNLPTDKCLEALAQWVWPHGPLVRRGGRWDWIAWPFSFGRLAQFIDRRLIEGFIDMAVRVLSIRDPAIDMPAEERWTATLHGKVLRHSSAARIGIAAATVLVAIHGDRMRNVNGQAAADAVVKGILVVEPDQMAERWVSATQVLDDLAEAAPDVFINCASELASNEAALRVVFQEGGHFGRSSHTYLLWGAERLAWSDDYLTPAVLLLGGLAEKDPGGQLTNRPANSLTEILLPWNPSTSASVAERLDAVDALHKQLPEVAWSMCMALFPGRKTFSSSTAKPKWREWDLGWHRPTRAEYRSYVEGLVDRLLTWAEESGSRWADLAGGLEHVKGVEVLQGRILDGLRHLTPEALAENERASIADALRTTINRHKRHQSAKWALTEEELAPLEELLEVFEPTNPIERHLWLFDAMPEIPGEQDVDLRGRFERARVIRREALKEIYDDSGLAGVLEVIERAEHPSDVGLALAELELSVDAEMEFLRAALACVQTEDETPKALQAAWQYVAVAYAGGGMEWLSRITKDCELSSSSDALLNIALALPPESTTWDKARGWGEDVEGGYWRRTAISVLRNGSEDAERAIRSLLAAGRPYRALQVACLAEFHPAAPSKGPQVVPSDLIAEILRSLMRHAPDDEWYPPDRASLSHYVERLFLLLDESSLDAVEVAQLEFPLLPLLEHTTRGPRQLREAIKTEPGIFVQLLKLVYRAEDEDERKVAEHDQTAARLAHSLLFNLREVPGTEWEKGSERDDLKKRFDGDVAFSIGKMDAEYLDSWVVEARRLAEECGRLDICDSQIGQLLASSPADEDGTWPCEAVRGLLETLKSESLEQGLHVGVFNKRGVHFRPRGGELEWAISERFRAFTAATRSKWPRTAAVLRGIAEDFAQQARREDEEGLVEEFE